MGNAGTGDTHTHMRICGQKGTRDIEGSVVSNLLDLETLTYCYISAVDNKFDYM